MTSPSGARRCAARAGCPAEVQANLVLGDSLDSAPECVETPLEVLAVRGQVGPAVPGPGVDDVRRVDESLLVAVVLVEDEAAHPAGPEERRNSSCTSWPRAASVSVAASHSIGSVLPAATGPRQTSASVRWAGCRRAGSRGWGTGRRTRHLGVGLHVGVRDAAGDRVPFRVPIGTASMSSNARCISSPAPTVRSPLLTTSMTYSACLATIDATRVGDRIAIRRRVDGPVVVARWQEQRTGVGRQDATLAPLHGGSFPTQPRRARPRA